MLSILRFGPRGNLPSSINVYLPRPEVVSRYATTVSVTRHLESQGVKIAENMLERGKTVAIWTRVSTEDRAQTTAPVWEAVLQRPFVPTGSRSEKQKSQCGTIAALNSSTDIAGTDSKRAISIASILAHEIEIRLPPALQSRGHCSQDYSPWD